MAYVPDPKAKGLDVVVGGWAAAGVDGARLEVYGLDPDWARAHLRRTGVAEPDSLELRGTVPATEFRARLRRARVFVHGARWEDWGQAPLEALADGALLATVPSGGPYEGLRLARQLEPALVAGDIDAAALALAIRAAFELPGERAHAYRDQAAELLRPYPSESVQETVAARAPAGAARLARQGAHGAQHGSLPRLHVRLGRVALGDGAAARRQALAQLGLAHEPAERRGDLRAVVRVHHQRVLALHGHVAGRARAP